MIKQWCAKCSEPFLAVQPYDLCAECDAELMQDFYQAQDVDWAQEKQDLQQ